MRWSLALVAVCSLAGCDALLGIHHLDGDAGGGGDAAARDSGPTIDAAPVCLGSATFTLCVGAPSSGIMLPSSIDTDTLSCPKLVTADGQKWCVFAGTDITLDGGVTTTVTGQFPLVLFATGTIHIAGTLDAGSHAGGSSGPAANGAQCVAPNVGTNANDVENGGAAGAGGSFASIGGNGGTGELGTAAGQETGPLAAPTQLVGGCPGSTGGAGAEPGTDECTPNLSDPAGAGGGAVALLAGTAIIVDGAVSVSGAGGGAGRLARGGGAGGGTGGMLVVIAPTISGGGALAANGGGGGGGADHCGNALPGGDGAASSASPAGGGAGGTTDCPNGGTGAAGSTVAASGGDGGTKGGSAGGGGLGYIFVHGSETITGTVSGVVTQF